MRAHDFFSITSPCDELFTWELYQCRIPEIFKGVLASIRMIFYREYPGPDEAGADLRSGWMR